MTDHVAVLRALRKRVAITAPDVAAALDHAIAICEQHAALVARLGDAERWKQSFIDMCALYYRKVDGMGVEQSRIHAEADAAAAIAAMQQEASREA